MCPQCHKPLCPFPMLVLQSLDGPKGIFTSAGLPVPFSTHYPIQIKPSLNFASVFFKAYFTVRCHQLHKLDHCHVSLQQQMQALP